MEKLCKKKKMSHKRERNIDSSQTKTTNRFQPLDNDESEEQLSPNTDNNSQPKIHKPCLIFIHGITNKVVVTNLALIVITKLTT